MKRLKLFLLVFIISLSVQAQINRYVVYFTDKSSTPYSLSFPEQYLSAKAIARRFAQGIAVTEKDLPVDPAYVNGLKNAGADVFYTTRWLNGAVIQVDQSLISSIEGLSYVDSVAYAAPGSRLTKNSRKTDDLDELPPLKTAVQTQMLGVDILHKEGYKGEGILIAYFDGGFRGVNIIDPFQHIFVENRMFLELNLVENNNNVYQYSSHGTKVLSTTAGLLAGEFTGTAPEANFMLFVTEDASSEYRIEEYNWLIAAEKADSAGTDIISSSVGYFDFDDPSMNYTYDDMDGQTTIVAQAATLASERGIVVVVSAGNEGNKSWKYVTSPADADNILAVGAVDATGEISNFSSQGPTVDGRIKPDVVALGSGTTIINESGIVTTGSGTSYAAPLITGLAALVWQVNPDLTNLELIALIKSIGNRMESPDNLYGYGIPDYTIIAPPEPDGQLFSLFPNPVAEPWLTIKTCCRQNIETEISFIDAAGKVVNKFMVPFSRNVNLYTVNTSHLEQGLYLVVLKTATGTEKYRIIKY